MLKLKTYNKDNANSVGADGPVRPHFKGNTKNTPTANSNPNSKIQILTSDPKGITLIALIITIIIMLILVGVTINVALNGGLFKKAGTATKQTKKEIEKEQLMEIVIAAYDPNNGGVNFDNVKLPDGFKQSYLGSKKAVYEGPSGQLYEVQKKTGNINEVDEVVEDKSIVGTYYLPFPDMEEEIHIEIDAEGNAILYEDGESLQVIYEYDESSNEGFIWPEGYEDEKIPFEYHDIYENEEIVNTIIIVYPGIIDSGGNMILTTKVANGLIPLNDYVYKSEDNYTIEFRNKNINDKIYGTFILKDNGEVVGSGEGEYVCYNNILITNRFVYRFFLGRLYNSRYGWGKICQTRIK